MLVKLNLFYLEKDLYLESDKIASVGICVKLRYPINILYGVIFRLNRIEQNMAKQIAMKTEFYAIEKEN